MSVGGTRAQGGRRSSPSTARPARCWPGRVPMTEPALSGEFATLMGWADEVRKLGVRANADTPDDARVALKFGAEGIGLCRTEHMFFDEDRIRAVREMILADDEKARRAALAKLLPMQRARFRRAVRDHGGPAGDDPAARSAAARVPAAQRRGDRRGRRRHGAPTRRSSRSARASCTSSIRCSASAAAASRIAYPEIAEMQARAIFEAAVEAGKRTGKPVVPEVMVPLIATKAELDLVKARIDAMAEAVARETETQGRLPGRHHDRAAARGAARRRDRRERRVLLLRHQRPDADHLRHQPRRRGELPRHLHGARHSRRAIRSSRSTARASASWCASASSAAARRAPKLKLGICGEHGGDPASVAFCHEVGLDYVSCSPFRVPIARLAAAQAALGKDPASQA